MSSSLMNLLSKPSTASTLQSLQLINPHPVQSLYTLQNLQEMDDDLQEQFFEIAPIDAIGVGSLLLSRQFWDTMGNGIKWGKKGVDRTVYYMNDVNLPGSGAVIFL